MIITTIIEKSFISLFSLCRRTISINPHHNLILKCFTNTPRRWKKVIKIKTLLLFARAFSTRSLHLNCSIYLTVNRKKTALLRNSFLRESSIEIFKFFAGTFASTYLVPARWLKDFASYVKRFFMMEKEIEIAFKGLYWILTDLKVDL